MYMCLYVYRCIRMYTYMYMIVTCSYVVCSLGNMCDSCLHVHMSICIHMYTYMYMNVTCSYVVCSLRNMCDSYWHIHMSICIYMYTYMYMNVTCSFGMCSHRSEHTTNERGTFIYMYVYICIRMKICTCEYLIAHISKRAHNKWASRVTYDDVYSYEYTYEYTSSDVHAHTNLKWVMYLMSHVCMTDPWTIWYLYVWHESFMNDSIHDTFINDMIWMISSFDMNDFIWLIYMVDVNDSMWHELYFWYHTYESLMQHVRLTHRSVSYF